jgi:hypothetical protein
VPGGAFEFEAFGFDGGAAAVSITGHADLH